jgi:magnesium transporter
MSKKVKRPISIKKGLPPGTPVYTGYRESRPSEVRTIIYDGATVEIVERYAPELRHSGKMAWFDVRNLSDSQFIDHLGEYFEIHPLAVEDILNTRQRPKMDEYDNGIFIVLPHIKFNPLLLELGYEQISIFLTHQTVVTFQEDPDDTFLPVFQRIKEGTGRIRKKNVDYLTYSLIDTVVDNYFIALDEIEVTMLDIENELHNTGENSHCKTKIFNLKYVLSQFRHSVIPLREAVSRLHRSDSPILPEVDQVYLRDVADHISQVLDFLDNFRDQLVNLEALYQAEVNNRMNNVMKLLTIISTIFIPLSFVAGVYGMNFKHMPELEWYYGYFIVLGSMFTIMVGMLIYFKKKNWI